MFWSNQQNANSSRFRQLCEDRNWRAVLQWSPTSQWKAWWTIWQGIVWWNCMHYFFHLWFSECFQLYNYEVAETFFLCKNTSQYVELEFGAHGEHLVLFLNGRRNDIMKMLPLNYSASIGKYILQLPTAEFFFFVKSEFFKAMRR